MKLNEYVKSLTENFRENLIVVNKLNDNGFSDQVYIGSTEFAFDNEDFLNHQDYNVLTITGGAGEALSVLIEE